MRTKIFIVGLILLYVVSFFLKPETPQTENGKPEAVTSASAKKVTWVPEAGETYEVLGYTRGMKGCTIKYSDSLYRGGNPLSAEGGKYLQKLGIGTVISVTPDDNIQTICDAVGIDNIPLYYDYGKLDESHVDSFIKLLETVEYPIFVHCYSGKQRAGLLCAISRIYKESWSFDKAEAEYGKLGGNVEEDHPLLLMADSLIKSM